MAYDYRSSGSRQFPTSRASMPLSPSDLFNSRDRLLINQHQNTRSSIQNNTDVLLYEYEIIDKKKEAKYIDEQVRNKGYCICSRWIFIFGGNVLILLIVAGLLGLLMYLNIPPDSTKAPLTFNSTCVTGSSTCDTIANLRCLNSRCTCLSNMVYNGTDCICNETTHYWDGAFCNTLKEYGESCNSTAPCLSYLLCDNTTRTCNCSFDKYYSNGACLTQKGFNVSPCSSYLECKYYLGLTCSSNVCTCNTNFYWDNTKCTTQLTWGASCPNNIYFGTACNTSAGLVVCSAQNTGQCLCQSTFYWDGSKCVAKGTFSTACTTTAWSSANNQCDSTYGLICGTGTCNCGTPAAVANTCDCPNGFFWDGQRCIAKKSATGTCLHFYFCTSNNCLFGFCQ